MNFAETLQAGCFCLDLAGNTKQAVIEEMIDLLVGAGQVRDREKVLGAILEREQKMSTGMSNGVAIPHGKTDAVDEMVTAFALKRSGIEFEAFDGKPCRIFVMTRGSNHMADAVCAWLKSTGSRVRSRPAAPGSLTAW